MPFVGPLKIKLQVISDGQLAFGPGKADLLEAIDSYGSISAAGREMGMSYRRAWLLVETMNRCWSSPLIDTTPGGGAEKGARLTPIGRKVLGAYRTLEARFAIEAAEDPAFKILISNLLIEPQPPAP